MDSRPGETTGNLKIVLGGTCDIFSPEMADGQLQTFACPNAGEVQLVCTAREVTEQARTPDCGVSSTTTMVHISTLVLFGFWDR